MTPARRAALIVAVAVLVAGVAAGAVWSASKREAADTGAGTPSASASASPSASATPTQTPDETPSAEPTQAPAEEGPADPDASGRTAVTVQVTFAGWQEAAATVEVGGYADVIESDGRCVLALTQAGTTVTREVAALPDATTTSCGTLSVPGTDLAPGTWTATLSYESTTATGTSEPLTIEVPR